MVRRGIAYVAGVATKKMTKTRASTDRILKELRAFGLGYPGAHLKSPWPDHMDLAVRDKTFTYLSTEGAPLALSCKLPHSGVDALALPFTKPTAYGLGKSGWVSADFSNVKDIPVALLKEWIDESYRAQAPKKLVAELESRSTPAKTTKKKPPRRKIAK